MPWVPIAETGLEYSFENGAPGTATMVGSTITAVAQSLPDWYLSNDSAETLQFRLTIAYSADTGGQGQTSPSEFTWQDGDGENQFVENEAGDPDAGFVPTPITGTLRNGFTIDYAAGSAEWDVLETYSVLVEVWVEGPDEVSYNCECEDEYPTRTLAQMREFMMIRLGWGAMKDTPLPGVNDTLNAFLQDAQEQLHAEYRLPRMQRFFTWDLLTDVRFYDLDANRDVCTKKLDPRQVTWVGISDGDDAWRPLVCGIPPESYYGQVNGIPTRYEIRQCIELWPPPGGDNWKLRIKGYFYSQLLEADDDIASIDYTALQLFALANAKAHYGQAQDAANVMRQAMRYIANMTAGAHHTRRFVPGTTEWVAPPLPVLTGYPGDP